MAVSADSQSYECAILLQNGVMDTDIYYQDTMMTIFNGKNSEIAVTAADLFVK
jgi:hypothetical protein